MGNHLNGKVAIVTGGASGLGLAFTKILAGEGDSGRPFGGMW